MRSPELAAHLKAGMKPVYLIFGPEEYFRTQALRLLREKAEAAKYDVAEFDGGEMEPRKFFDDLRTPSLFAPNRLVIVEHAELLFGAPLQGLIHYAAKPSHQTVLALAAEELKAKGPRRGPRKKTEEAPADLSALLKKVTPVECPVLNRRELPLWCMARSRELGKKMDSAAAGMLIELAGSNPGALNGQIESLVSFCKERPSIASDDVSRLVGGDHMRTIWDLLTAVSERKPAPALRALDRLMRDGDMSASGIIGFMAQEVRRTLIVKRLHEEGASPAKIEQVTHAKGWLIEKILRTSRRVSVEELKRHLHLLVQADYDIKTGAGRDEWVMERLVMQLCGGK